MDFEVKEEKEFDEEKEQKKNKTLLIIIIVFALVIGLIVFLLFNGIFNKKTKPVDNTPKSQKLLLTNSNVKILYDYVTYSSTGVRDDKFVTEDKTSLETFSNQEKFYYALQFANASDFSLTGDVDEEGEKEYLITSRKIKSYMERFFGSNVTYSNDEVIKYQFDFTRNDLPIDVSTLKYSSKLNGFVTTFKYKKGYEPKEEKKDDKIDDSKKEENDPKPVTPPEKEEEIVLVQPFYTKLYAAYQDPDGTYRLEEKVIYTKLEDNGDDTYNVSIYADYANTKLLESKLNQTKESLLSNPISINKYIDKASTVTYYFKLNRNVLYYDSSKIK